jgi:ATP-dependent RNA helicase DeaD
VPRAIATLAKNYQNNAVRIATTTEREQHADIDYQAMVVSPADREHAIINVLRFHEARNALVFCATRAAVNHLTARLNNRGFSVVALSGELSQTERTHALQAMRDGRARVCVATDVAARGIDLPGLELVIHADLPTNPETLLHRSGRTGRAGRKGVSALIVPVNARKRADRLLRMAQIQAEWTPPPSAQAVIERDNERLLAHPLLADPVSEDERAQVDALLEKHGADALAAGFMRLAREGKSAPEDVQPIADRGERGGERREPRERKERQPFGEAVWFRLSVGRKQNAEPRWLLPMICRAGDMTKRDIGAIRIQADETHVEISTGAADAFLAGLGDNMTLEKSIRVSRLEDDAPDAPAPADEGRRHEPPRNAPPPKKQKKKSTKKYAGRPEAEHRDRPKPPSGAVAPKANPFAGYTADPQGDAPAADKPRGKKPGGKSFGKPGGKPGDFKGKTGGGPSKAAKAKFGKSNFSKAKSAGKAGAKGKPKGKSAGKP